MERSGLRDLVSELGEDNLSLRMINEELETRRACVLSQPSNNAELMASAFMEI